MTLLRNLTMYVGQVLYNLGQPGGFSDKFLLLITCIQNRLSLKLVTIDQEVKVHVVVLKLSYDLVRQATILQWNTVLNLYSN